MVKKQVGLVGVLVLCAGLVCAKGTVGPEVTAFQTSKRDPGAGEWISDYLRRFFEGRVKEPATYALAYQTRADAWLHDALWNGAPVQQRWRNRMLGAVIDAEGYVSSHQHFSSSQDEGWPFPVWPQVPGERGFRGTTAGWHFYEKPEPAEIVIRNLLETRHHFPGVLGREAADVWVLEGMADRGMTEEKPAGWKLTTGGVSAWMVSPEGVHLDAFNSAYIQIRWSAEQPLKHGAVSYMEWLREGDTDWCESRRMAFYPETTTLSATTKHFHSTLRLYRHPEWTGTIERIRFSLLPDEPARDVVVNSIFTHWDTRHLVNNAIQVKAAWEYFRWTGDLDFLRQEMPRLRFALRFMMDEGHALELKRIRCTWHGHDGRPGYTVHEDGSKTWHVGQSKGGNYWDLLPLGWDDMYTTIHYYAALEAMAQLEEAALNHPGWDLPGGFMRFDPVFLREHAAEVKEESNRLFWNEETGRFIGCIDADGKAYDYGFTFINLEAIHYGIANEENARAIMEWINGERLIEGDTSTGEDIYVFRLAPRATTKRNIEWYGFFWTGPETIPFGAQIQDGGAVLGFSFYDVMSRIATRGADDAWRRLMEIRAWDEEAQAYGGYRAYYASGKGGTTLQGAGTAGGIGIDMEFTESSMIPSLFLLGFMGVQPDGQVLRINPDLPADCPEMAVRKVLYHGVPMDIIVSNEQVKIVAHKTPSRSLPVLFNGQRLVIDRAGTFVLPDGSNQGQ